MTPKIAWIAPDSARCGISIYSERYLQQLHPLCRIERFTPRQCSTSPRACAARINACDCVHIQYETSQWLSHRGDRYRFLCRRLTVPVCVTLHEVYEQLPGVFPREQIEGPLPLRIAKKAVYDIRHPAATAYRRHLKHDFFAHRLFVHARYHIDLLGHKGVDTSKINHIPMPVPDVAAPQPPRLSHKNFTEQSPLLLGTIGFINPQYDYTLLLETLSRLEIPWHFFWIGTIRRGCDHGLYSRLCEQLERYGMSDRFTITHWVDDAHRTTLLTSLDIALALFSSRSCSSSLATLIGARRYIVATDIDLTREIRSREPVMELSSFDPEEVRRHIQRIIETRGLQRRLARAMTAYRANWSFRESARRIFAHYREICNV